LKILGPALKLKVKVKIYQSQIQHDEY